MITGQFTPPKTPSRKDRGDTRTVRVGWVPAGSCDTASSRLRAYRIHDYLSCRSGRFESLILHSFDASMRLDILVLQRVYGTERFNDLIRSLRKRGTKVILDLCDTYPEARATAETADIVTTSSEWRAKQLALLGFSCSFRVIQEPVDYDIDSCYAHPDMQDLRPVWFGTYTNIDLVRTVPAPITATAISSRVVRDSLPSYWQFIEWDYRSFPDLIRRFNVCLLPQNDPGKSANKMVTAIACGLPVIASDIPAYRELAELAGIEEFLCRVPEDWLRSMERLKRREKRLRYVDKAQPVILKRHHMDVVATRWIHLFEDLLSRPSSEAPRAGARGISGNEERNSAEAPSFALWATQRSPQAIDPRAGARGLLAKASETSPLTTIQDHQQDPELLNDLGVLSYRKQDLAGAVDYFTRALRANPFHRDAIFNYAHILREWKMLHHLVPLLEQAVERDPYDREIQALFDEAGSHSKDPAGVGAKRPLPWKMYYSPGIAHHGEKVRRMLDLDRYVPSLHRFEPVWFFGLYFPADYHEVLSHQGMKIINWRGSDALQLRENPSRIQAIQHTRAIHVCQSVRQQEILADLGIPSIVRPMLNVPVSEVALTPFPKGHTAILVFWRRGIDAFIQADLFFRVAGLCPEVSFHIVGDEDPRRFSQPGMGNITFHGFLPEKELDQLMDRCKGTMRPWISDGTPNIQTRMLLKGRYAAHTCRFEKVAQCRTAEDYAKWISHLMTTDAPNLEAREWWMHNLNKFDFLDRDFPP